MESVLLNLYTTSSHQLSGSRQDDTTSLRLPLALAVVLALKEDASCVSRAMNERRCMMR